MPVQNQKNKTQWIKEHKGIFLGVLVPLFLAPFVVGYILNDIQFKKEKRTEVITQLITDLEKIKTIAPSNISLEDCLGESNQKDFDDNYEKCFKKVKQNGEDTRSLLERNQYPIQTFFGDKLFSKVKIYLDTIDYGLYEMNNNQLVIEKWKVDNCPDRVDFISVDEFRDRTPLGEVKCSLSVQTQQQFLESQNENSPCDPEYDCISATKSRFAKYETVEEMIVPGESISFTKHMAHTNSLIYTQMLGFVDELLAILRNEAGI